jgi:hypothetical protein
VGAAAERQQNGSRTAAERQQNGSRTAAERQQERMPLRQCLSRALRVTTIVFRASQLVFVFSRVSLCQQQSKQRSIYPLTSSQV